MTTPAHAAAEARIREMMRERVEAIKAKDVDALVAHHAPSVLAFDLLEPLQYVGLEGLRKRAEQWLEGYDGPMEYEIRDLKVTADDEVAFCHGLHRVAGTTRDGRKIDMYWRSTECLRKLGDKWCIVHEHASVPFNMETGKVSFDLRP